MKLKNLNSNEKAYIILYAEDFDTDVWEEYCDVCGASHNTISLQINFNINDVVVVEEI